MSERVEEAQLTVPRSTIRTYYSSSEDPDQNHPPCTAIQLPHRCSALSRSIVDFCQFMMGGTGADFQLPNPPTPEELKAWKEWVAERKAKVHGYPAVQVSDANPEKVVNIKELGDLKPSDQQRSRYQSAPIPANHEINKFYKTLCDNQFQSNGFPRITFEWEKSSFKDSEWNSATADLLADQWRLWYLQNRLFSTKDEHFVDAKAVIGRWIQSAPNISSTRRQSQKGAGEDAAPDEQARSSAAADGHRRKRSAVADARRQTADTIFMDFPAYNPLYSLMGLITTDAVSDYDDSEDPADPPTRINPFWRSDEFSEFMHALDLATFQLAGPSNKRRIADLLARNGSREANEVDASAERAPRGFPEDAYSEEFLADTSELERRQLGSYDITADRRTFTEALAFIQKCTRKA